MESWDALDAIGAALDALRRRKLEGSQLSPGDDTQVTMDWFLDDGQSPSEVLEETGVHVIEPPSEPVRLVGIDGSSRRFSTPYGGFVVASASVTWGPLPVADYPPLSFRYPFTLRGSEPFMATYKELGVEHRLIATESPAGNEYRPRTSSNPDGYSLAVMAHQVRTQLETLGLEGAIDFLGKTGGGNKGVAIIDGPLYQRPWGRDIFRSEQLKRDWGELTRRRIEVLERARGEGVIVAGSVKRLDKSRLLVRAHGSLAGTLEIVYPPQDNDQAEAVALARRYIKERGLKDFRPLLIGPLKMRPPQNLAKDLGIDPPDIAYSYIVIPHLPYRGSLEGHCSVLRVELLWDTYEGLCSRSVDVFFLLAAEGFVKLGLPPAQDFAHRRCNKLSHALFEEMCRRALSEGIDLTYDTYDMFARGAAYEE